jgi:hypothetical protein
MLPVCANAAGTSSARIIAAIITKLNLFIEASRLAPAE